MEIPFLLMEDQMCMVLVHVKMRERRLKERLNDLTYDNIVYELIEKLEH